MLIDIEHIAGRQQLPPPLVSEGWYKKKTFSSAHLSPFVPFPLSPYSRRTTDTLSNALSQRPTTAITAISDLHPASHLLSPNAMAPTLETWPPETIETLCTHLPLPDLCALRLTSKALSGPVTQDTFKSYYRVKHLDAAPCALAAFAQVTARPRSLAHEVRELVLCGVAVSTAELEKVVKERARWVSEGAGGPIFAATQHRLSDDEVVKAEEDLKGLKEKEAELRVFFEGGQAGELLAQAFRNLARFGKGGGLKKLRLEVVVLQEGVESRQQPIETRSKDVVWRAAETAFGVVVAGLAGSGMGVEEFDLFCGQRHCSLSPRALGCAGRLSGDGLEKALVGLRSLSLSLSADPSAAKDSESSGGGNDNDEDSSADDKRDNERRIELAHVLSLCPHLEHLHLHWFRLLSAGAKDQTAEHLLQPVAQQQTASNLQSLTIRGFHCKAPTLLGILQNAPLQTLHLENIILDAETPAGDSDDPAQHPPYTEQWQPIFTHLTRPFTTLTSLHFDDLWGHDLLHFKDSAKGLKFPWSEPTEGGPMLERNGKEEVRREIEVVYPGGVPLGSQEAYRWRMERKREFGPA